MLIFQSLGVHAFHVGGKSILLSTCGSNEVSAQAAAAADIIDMIRLMNERWQQFQVGRFIHDLLRMRIKLVYK